MATLVTDETIHSLYVDLARQWLRMAEDAEKLERHFSHLQGVAENGRARQLSR
jgi:hypothetical protein